MTAKATKKEQERVPHHLLDILDVKDGSYHVVKYREDGLKALNSIFARNKAAIVVGGTNYYAESLLFGQLEGHDKAPMAEGEAKAKLNQWPLEVMPPQVSDVSPAESRQFHPNDLRRRAEKKQAEALLCASRLNLDYQRTAFPAFAIIVLINKDKEFVVELMRKRIDEMLFQQSGFEEIFSVLDAIFLSTVLATGSTKIELTDETNRGLLQAIGYKEFLPLYNRINQRAFEATKADATAFLGYRGDLVVKLKSKHFGDFEEIVAVCVDDLLKKTFKLYKAQLKWLNARILSSPVLKSRLRVYEFGREMSQPGAFGLLTKKIIKELEDFNWLQQPDQSPKCPTLPISKPQSQPLSCAVCDKFFYTKQNYEQHLRSKGHRSRIRKNKAKDEGEGEPLQQNELLFCEPCKRSIQGRTYYETHVKSKPHLKRIKTAAKNPQTSL